MPYRLRILLLLLLPGTVLQAQDAVRIIDPQQIADAELTYDIHAQAAMQAAGLDEATMTRVRKFSVASKWPAGWGSDSTRSANAAVFPNVIAYRLCDVRSEKGSYAIVNVPVLENLHLPQEMRSAEEFFVLVGSKGLAVPPAPERPKASAGPNWRSMPKAKITRPEDVYATYNIANDPQALAMLEKRGLSQAEIDAIIFRSHERNWPEGIDQFEKRRTKLKAFKKFKAHMAARWDDKVLLVIPAEANKKLPAGLRPYMDIYMVYTGPAVAVMKK